MPDAEITQGSTPASSAAPAAPAAAAAPVASAPPAPAAQPVAAPVAAPAAAGTADAAPVTNSPATAPTGTEGASSAAAPSGFLSAEGDAPVGDKPAEKTGGVDAKADKPAEEKAADGTEDKPKEEGAAPAEPVEGQLPTYEPFKLPEGAKADEKALGDFTNMLAAFEASKPDHAKFQEFGQKLVEQYASVVQEQQKNLTDFYISIHNKQKADDFEALRQDPAFGGGDEQKFEKFGKEMANFIQAHGGSKEHVAQFRKDADERGFANVPSVVRLLNNLKAKIDKYEREATNIIVGGKPPSEKPAPGKGFMSALYGNSRK